MTRERKDMPRETNSRNVNRMDGDEVPFSQLELPFHFLAYPTTRLVSAALFSLVRAIGTPGTVLRLPARGCPSIVPILAEHRSNCF